MLQMTRYPAIFLSITLIVLVVLLFPTNNSTEAREHVIDLYASQFEFAPGRIEVNQGDTVVFKLHARDVVHGLYIDGYGIEQRVTPGVMQTIELTAEQIGKFRYRCSVSCGALHPFMIGELIVRPNSPLWKSVFLTLITLGGLLLILWRTTQERKYHV